MLVGWDTLGVPTYRNKRLPGLPGGREFDDELVEQLDLLPAARRRARASRSAKAAGYEADDFLAAAVAAERGRRRPCARRDLRPRRLPARERPHDDPPAGAGREPARAHRPGRGARALRRRARAGARLHRAPRRPVRQAPGRARRRGRRRRPRCSRQLRDARGGARRRALRRRGGRAAPLPADRDARRLGAAAAAPRQAAVDWGGGAALARELGAGRARRAAADDGGAVDVLSHPALARLHPTGPPPRAAGAARGRSSTRSAATRKGGTATPEQLERAHNPALRRPRPRARRPRPGSTATPSRRRRPTRRRGSPPGATSPRSDAAASRSSARRATTPCAAARWASASSTTSPIAARYAQAELGVERVAIVDWDVHHGNGTEAIFAGRPLGALRLAAPVAVLPRHGRAGHERRGR